MVYVPSHPLPPSPSTTSPTTPNSHFIGFYINLPIGFLASLTILTMHIPSLIPKPPFSFAHCRAILPELDLIGFALFVPPSIMFLLGLQLGSGNSMAWSSATIICLFVFAGVMALVFICWEARMGDKAMIPGSILGKRVVWTSCVFGTCLTCAMSELIPVSQLGGGGFLSLSLFGVDWTWRTC